MSDNLKRHRPDIKVLGEGKAIAFMPEDPMGVWCHIQEVRDLLDVKDRTIRDYEDNYLPRPKTMELKSWMIGSPETGEQLVYDAEEADRVIATKDAEIVQLQVMLEERNKQIGELKAEIANNAGWKRFDCEQPKLDRQFHIKYGPDGELNLLVLRVHREPFELPHFQRQEGSEWIGVGLANASWIARNCEWRYVAVAEKDKYKG